MSLVWAPRAVERFITNLTSAGFNNQGNGTTSPDGYLRIAGAGDSQQDIIGSWTDGGNVLDTERVSCSITIDYTFDPNQRQALAICYEWFSSQLAIGHDGHGKLALWNGDARSAAAAHDAPMTGGKPAQDTKIWFRGTRNGNEITVEEFREEPIFDSVPNTSFVFTIPDGGTFSAGHNNWKAGYVQHGVSPASHYDDFKIESLIEDRRAPGSSGSSGPSIPTEGRIWPRNDMIPHP
jgi:hypothetical protein